jgi:alkanesulfonate monooxygenase SsuD/methylene tetrahydromethanopterin reductase-like flavin-dependent oxidoreductase (luciferase family)
MDRLAEAAHLARDLFDHGSATLHGAHVVADDVPLSPVPATPPRLLLGGGSDRLLEIAGRYADVLDLNGSSRRAGVTGADLPRADLRRRLSTTVADLEASAERVRGVAAASGRARKAVRLSILIGNVEFCSNAEVPRVAERTLNAAGLEGESLDQCPYALLGEPERMADLLDQRIERLGLDMLILAGSIDPRPFCEQVLPRLSASAGASRSE